MSYSLIVHTGKQGSSSGITTDPIDTSGANFISVVVVFYAGLGATGVLTDNKGNTWIGLTSHSSGAGAYLKRYYCYNPTVGSGHTFSSVEASDYNAIIVSAWSGAAASPFDQDIAAAGTQHPGLLTPSENNCLVLSSYAVNNDGGFLSVDSGFTLLDSATAVPSNSEGGADAYIVQTTATAKNPSWDWTGSPGEIVVEMSIFKAAVIAAAPVRLNNVGHRPYPFAPGVPR